jgi:hypothetical protein
VYRIGGLAAAAAALMLAPLLRLRNEHEIVADPMPEEHPSHLESAAHVPTV